MQWKSSGETYGIMYNKAKDEVLLKAEKGSRERKSSEQSTQKKFKGDIISDVKYQDTYNVPKNDSVQMRFFLDKKLLKICENNTNDLRYQFLSLLKCYRIQVISISHSRSPPPLNNQEKQ